MTRKTLDIYSFRLCEGSGDIPSELGEAEHKLIAVALYAEAHSLRARYDLFVCFILILY